MIGWDKVWIHPSAIHLPVYVLLFFIDIEVVYIKFLIKNSLGVQA